MRPSGRALEGASLRLSEKDEGTTITAIAVGTDIVPGPAAAVGNPKANAQVDVWLAARFPLRKLNPPTSDSDRDIDRSLPTRPRPTSRSPPRAATAGWTVARCYRRAEDHFDFALLASVAILLLRS